MKPFRFVILSVLLAVFGTACRPANPLVPQPDTASMKGYELYSWKEDEQWCFSILIGTNREKTLEEIQSLDATLKGMEELHPVLESIPAGEFVTWVSGDGLAFPPDETIRQVDQVCRDQGLEFSLAR